jgi:phage terminase Nu1 subunit (DNA packaging protein)
LPESGSSFAFAKILGVSAPTVRNWIMLEGAPASRGPKARWTLCRDEFSKWLRERDKVCVMISEHSEPI